jgi:DNA-binding response OmpR family regulator
VIDQQADYILIVEPDDDLLKTLTAYFASKDSFKFHTVQQGSEILEAALKHRPKLILMETKLPDRPGLEVYRDLKLYPRTAHIPVIFLAGGTEVFLQNQILEAGAYDFIEKPFDVAEIGLRIQNALRRSRRDGSLHPNTRLPIGSIVQQAVENLAQKVSYYHLKIKIKGFGVFKDRYGFMSSNEVTIYAGNVIAEVVTEHGSPEDFVGHGDEDEFVVITTPERGPKIREAIEARVNSQLPQFYNFMDREQGYIEITVEGGETRQEPLMTLEFEVNEAS